MESDATATIPELTQTLASAEISTPVPLPSSLPTTLSRSYKLHGIPTDAFVQIFHDRIVVGISQRQQRIGTWCLCQVSQSIIDPKAIEVDLQTVLGDRSDAMAGVYARQIAERLIRGRFHPGSTNLTVFLGIALLDNGKDMKMFHSVIEVLLQLIQDALRQRN